ncbi:PH domain-containing protein [Sediminibacterium soli]|uniref:PH domain-containing protein n=1 Tax=Sediminibacterium soli TaxID=2698829 RepID=UPI00137B4469|nr:PH domain-containing protein [Sediminibacterium soli]NCI47107.1 hypothetical protein [Sediminibacterium soli]
MKYRASLDKAAMIITISVTVMFAGGIVLQYAVVQETAVPSIVSLLLLGIYITTYVFRPLYYVLTVHALIIHRPLGKVVIERSRIRSVGLLDDQNTNGTIRTFGVGGVFGYFGRFSNVSIGNMTWYATRRKKLVLVLTQDNQKIIITPDEAETFLAAFHQPTTEATPVPG